MRDTAIFSTKSYKYLGVYLDQKLNMNDDFEKKSQKMQWQIKTIIENSKLSHNTCK